MVVKIIHYCWFGRNQKPELIERCIASWKTYLPEFEIREWNEDNYDINSRQYVCEAYEAKKYAFVSDVVRLDVLYRFGGIYFDTDVELVRSIPDSMLEHDFMACEKQGGVITIAPGLVMAFSPSNVFLKEMLETYDNQSFALSGNYNSQYTINERFSARMEKEGWIPNNVLQEINHIYIYPSDYFCPYDGLTMKMHKTDNTYAIHWYMGSWIRQGFLKRIKRLVKKLLPETVYMKYRKIMDK